MDQSHLANASPVIDKFEINLEHDIDEQYQYEPGELLRGHVILALSGPIKLKTVQVQIKGEATVSWDEENPRQPGNFRADETYIDVTQHLVDPGIEDAVSLEKGKHRFPLEYRLPMNLPSSFIGKFGSITYVVKATLKEDKKFGRSTMITSEPFLVLRRLDLASEESLLQSVETSLQKTIWGTIAFCMYGKVTATLSVNRSGHLPGEDIFMDANITNDSPRIVKSVQASLVMHSTFHAKHNTRYNTQVVNKKRDEWEMMKGEGRRWRNVRLTIPPYIPESRLDGCDIIDIRYELVFRIEISGGTEMKMVIPITVGTVHGSEGAKQRALEGEDDKAMENGGEKANGVEGTNGTNEEGVNEDDVEVVEEGFRHPMEFGETRRNPLFMNEVSEEAE